MNANPQVSGHKHEASFRYSMSSHKGINLGTCACGTPVQEFEVQGRRIAIERTADKTVDLFERARSIGYDDDAAARLADCWVNYDMIIDPCMIHPNHSVSTDHQGYAVDGCQACLVLVRTHDAGWTMAGWQAEQAARKAEAERLHAEEGAALLVTSCGTFALGETVTHAEMGQATIVYLGSAGGMEVQFAGGGTVGVDEAHYGEWAQVRTDDPGTVPTDEAMAEAERDEMIEFNRAQAIARNTRRDAMFAEGRKRAQADKRDNMTGIDMIKEAVSLAPVAQAAPVHLLVSVGRTASGRLVGPRMQTTTDTSMVTCKCCPKTRKFQSEAYRQERDAARDMWAGAGLTVGMVVRNLATGHLGMINELDVSIRVGYWTGPQVKSTYARLVDFDSACEIIIAADLGVRAGVTLVSNRGGTCVVDEVGAVGVFATPEGETAARMWTLSELAAEIARGWLAVVPEVPTMTMVSASGRHTVGVLDLAQVGYRVTVAAGSPRNGTMTRVGVQGAEVTTANGDVWFMSLADLVNGDSSVWLPDANGRPVGSWR